ISSIKDINSNITRRKIMTTNTKVAKNSLQINNSNDKKAVSPTIILQEMLKENQKKLKAVLGDNSNAFMVSLVNLYNSDLVGVDPQTTLNAAFIAAALKLPIEKNLGFAYIIKYGDKAQFILGYKGIIQLALRSGGVKKLNSIPIKENQIKSFNPLTEEIEFDMENTEGEVVGYAAYMELTNGFNKIIYMSKKEISDHAEKFSQTYKADIKWGKSNSVWAKNFDEMAMKTIIKKILKFAPLSTEMQMMERVDQASITKVELTENGIDVGVVDYVDNKNTEVAVEEKATKEEVLELLANANVVNLNLKKISSELHIDFENMTKPQLEKLQNVIDEKTEEMLK
ncbi:MAG: recombinase RecT, partial [Cetobacterium sp.]